MKTIETDIEKITKKLEEEGCRVLTEEELRLKVNGGWGKSSSGGSSSSTRSSSSGSHGGSSGSRNSSKNSSGSSKKSGSAGTTKTSFGQKVSNVVNSIKSWAQAHAPTNKIDKAVNFVKQKIGINNATSQRPLENIDGIQETDLAKIV